MNKKKGGVDIALGLGRGYLRGRGGLYPIEGWIEADGRIPLRRTVSVCSEEGEGEGWSKEQWVDGFIKVRSEFHVKLAVIRLD